MDPASTWLLQVVVAAAAAALLLLLLWVQVRERVVGRAGGLPPGRLGLPLLGETLQLVSAYKTEQPEPFVDERVRGGHRVFTTHLFGEATVFSADPEVNRQVLLGEGRLFESSYPTSISTLLGRRSLLLMRGALHRRMHALLSSTIASPTVIRHSLLPDIDRLVRRTLDSWEEEEDHPAPSSGTARRVLLQDQAKKITFELTVKQLMSVEPGEWTEGLRREYLRLIEGFFSIPIPFSFTTYGRALQARTKVAEAVRSVVRERKREMGIRKSSDESSTGSSSRQTTTTTRRKRDLLGALLEAETEEGAPEFPDEEEAVDFLLALLVAGYETTSTIITLAVKYLTDHPRALALLREEHEGIRKRKDAEEPAGDFLDWADYKSMTFTHCVINETLRVANIISGVFRRAVADVPIKGGYTIPKGCKVFASFRAVHMDPAYYSEARTFNPWRWCSQSQQQQQQQKKQPQEASVFCPFGGGPRLCPGYELARVEISVFLHYLVTRFTWEVAEDDRVVFFPTTRTIKGYPINVRTRLLHRCVATSTRRR